MENLNMWQIKVATCFCTKVWKTLYKFLTAVTQLSFTLFKFRLCQSGLIWWTLVWVLYNMSNFVVNKKKLRFSHCMQFVWFSLQENRSLEMWMDAVWTLAMKSSRSILCWSWNCTFYRWIPFTEYILMN